MRLTDAAEDLFARHETFHPRYSWFRKAYYHAHQDNQVFNKPDAPSVIGVGKNMVRAILFWGTAAKLITDKPYSSASSSQQNNSSRKSGEQSKHLRKKMSKGYVPTRRGQALFGENGWDPYMEDPGTVWLLHWMLLAQKSKLPVWWLAFNKLQAVQFTQDELTRSIDVWLDETLDVWRRKPHDRTVAKDISALLRTYTSAIKSRRTRFDDMLDSPFRELNLLRRVPERGDTFRFTLGDKPTLPAEIVTHAVFDYIARLQYTDRSGTMGYSETVDRSGTITVSRLSKELGSPGKAFKLDESWLRHFLQSAAETYTHHTQKHTRGRQKDDKETFQLVDLTGDTQLAWTGEPARIATLMLDFYYDSRTPQSLAMCAGPEGDKPDLCLS